MKSIRKGFTLIELLIVVAIMGALAAMMASSSSDAIDQAQANAILNNLQSMKTAAYTMYMEKPEVAGLTAISGNNQAVTLNDAPTDSKGKKTATTVGAVLGEFLGTKMGVANNYGIFGDADHWYVYYEIQATDSAKVQAILQDKAKKLGLLAADDATVDGIDDYGPDYYNSGYEYAVLMVR